MNLLRNCRWRDGTFCSDGDAMRKLKIGRVENEVAFEESVKAFTGNISVKEAAARIVARTGMNPTSASDSVRTIGHMMRGKPYKRTLSELATEIFLTGIRDGFDNATFRGALSATRAHLIYYQNLKNGGPSRGRWQILEAFEAQAETYSSIAEQFQDDVKKSLSDTSEARDMRLKKAPRKPRQRTISTQIYVRNPDVVATVLIRANGVCEYCKMTAPFLRLKDGSPYLEVHHRVPLSEDGNDVVENAIALCPNCHRDAHFGEGWRFYRDNREVTP